MQQHAPDQCCAYLVHSTASFKSRGRFCGIKAFLSLECVCPTWHMSPDLFPLQQAHHHHHHCVCTQEHERYCPTPPHPTGIWSWKSSACVCRTARKMMRLRCLCVHRNMSVMVPPHPTPRVTDHERAVPVSVRERLRCLCEHRNMSVMVTPPHRTPQPTMMKVQWLFPEWEMMRVRKWVTFCSLGAQVSEGAQVSQWNSGGSPISWMFSDDVKIKPAFNVPKSLGRISIILWYSIFYLLLLETCLGDACSSAIIYV